MFPTSTFRLTFFDRALRMYTQFENQMGKSIRRPVRLLPHEAKPSYELLNSKTTWSEFHMPSQTAPAEAKPSCVYSIWKPQGQSFITSPEFVQSSCVRSEYFLVNQYFNFHVCLFISLCMVHTFALYDMMSPTYTGNETVIRLAPDASWACTEKINAELYTTPHKISCVFW